MNFEKGLQMMKNLCKSFFQRRLYAEQQEWARKGERSDLLCFARLYQRQAISLWQNQGLRRAAVSDNICLEDQKCEPRKMWHKNE